MKTRSTLPASISSSSVPKKGIILTFGPEHRRKMEEEFAQQQRAKSEFYKQEIRWPVRRIEEPTKSRPTIAEIYDES